MKKFYLSGVIFIVQVELKCQLLFQQINLVFTVVAKLKFLCYKQKTVYFIISFLLNL